MGREIRRVPPQWEHPQHGVDSGRMRDDSTWHFIPMYDQDYAEACAEWKANFAKWEAGENPDRANYGREHPGGYEYWEWSGNPPNRETYRAPFAEEPTWLQAYETVSEGTPVSPPFAKPEELVDYLVENGDYWYQEDMRQGKVGTFRTKPTREQAVAFVQYGYTPSMVVATHKDGSVTVKSNYETLTPDD